MASTTERKAALPGLDATTLKQLCARLTGDDLDNMVDSAQRLAAQILRLLMYASASPDQGRQLDEAIGLESDHDRQEARDKTAVDASIRSAAAAEVVAGVAERSTQAAEASAISSRDSARWAKWSMIGTGIAAVVAAVALAVAISRGNGNQQPQTPVNIATQPSAPTP